MRRTWIFYSIVTFCAGKLVILQAILSEVNEYERGPERAATR